MIEELGAPKQSLRLMNKEVNDGVYETTCKIRMRWPTAPGRQVDAEAFLKRFKHLSSLTVVCTPASSLTKAVVGAIPPYLTDLRLETRNTANNPVVCPTLFTCLKTLSTTCRFVVHLDLAECRGISTKGVVVIANAYAATLVSFKVASSTDNRAGVIKPIDVTPLSKCSRLELLEFRCRCPIIGLHALSSTRIARLSLRDSLVEEADLVATLPGLARLTHLSLSDCARLTNVAVLSGIATLQVLYMLVSPMQMHATMLPIRALSNLVHLVMGMHGDQNDAHELLTMPSLKSAYLKVAGDLLSAGLATPNLTNLHFATSTVIPDFAFLERCRHLRALSVFGRVKDLGALATTCPDLEWLDVHLSGPELAGVASLLACRHLRSLIVHELTPCLGALRRALPLLTIRHNTHVIHHPVPEGMGSSWW